MIRAEKRIRDDLALVESQIERLEEIIVNPKDIGIHSFAKQSMNLFIKDREKLLFELEEVEPQGETQPPPLASFKEWWNQKEQAYMQATTSTARAHGIFEAGWDAAMKHKESK